MEVAFLPLEKVIIQDAFRTPNMLSMIQCTICTEVLKEPMTLSCGHIFCKKCCDRFGGKCPVDRIPWTHMSPSFQIISLLDEVKCRCDFPECSETFALSDREKHLGKCQYRKILCSHGCGQFIEVKDLSLHDRTCDALKSKICQRIFNELMKEEITLESGDEATAVWKCTRCTFENKNMSAHKCEACGGDRFPAEKTQWACPKCTVINKITDATCQTCTHKREKMTCTACTVEYPITKPSCPTCNLKNPAYRMPRASLSGYRPQRRDDRRYTNINHVFSEEEDNDEYDPAIFKSLVYHENENGIGYYVDDEENELESSRQWRDWYEENENDYIVVIGRENHYQDNRRETDRKIGSGGRHYRLAGLRRALTLVAIGQKEDGDYALYKELNQEKLRDIAKSFHWILEKASQLTNRNKEDSTIQKKIYLLEDTDGKVRYGLDPVNPPRVYQSRPSGALGGTPKKKKKSCRKRLNDWFELLKKGTMTHNMINALARGEKISKGRKKKAARKSQTSKRKPEIAPSGSAKKKRKLARTDTGDDDSEPFNPDPIEDWDDATEFMERDK